MPPLSEQDQAANLRKFFALGANSVTRERIFFNRLSFDLKIAAARADYHLHLYEPDVDRDSFDIVVEDQDDGMGWFQLKAVLRSAATANWKTTAGFLRPHSDIGEAFGFDPVDCGRGGGVILIEIDDTNARGDVVYSYTDFRILTALAERFLVEDVAPTKKKRGRPPSTRQSAAAGVIALIRASNRNDEVTIPRSAFVELKTADGLLTLMALQSSQDFGPFSIHQACRDGVTIDDDGNGMVADDGSIAALGNLRYHMRALVGLLSARSPLRAFDFKSPFVDASSPVAALD